MITLESSSEGVVMHRRKLNENSINLGYQYLRVRTPYERDGKISESALVKIPEIRSWISFGLFQLPSASLLALQLNKVWGAFLSELIWKLVFTISSGISFSI